MNGGSWPAKCSSGWSPVPTEAAIPSPPQSQMGINSIIPARLPVSQELPVFNGLNPVGSLMSPALPLLSGKYPHFQSFSLGSLHSDNVLQVNSTGFTPVACARPFLKSHGKEAQNLVLQSSFPKTVNVGHTQSAHRVQTLDFRAPQKTPVNAISSSWHGDQRIVFCMNTVGELFFADSGHLGVVCFCHRSKMSMAKFCEHSGGIPSKAGESVYMENGMTISRWARLFLGVHSTYWDWPDNSSLQASVIQSGSLDGSIVRSNNRTVYKNQLSKVGPINSETNTALNGNLNEYNSSLSPNCTSAARKGKTSAGIPNNGFQWVSHSTNGSNFTGQGISLGDSARNKEDTSSSPFASRFELKLGQPPNLISNSTKGVIPTSLQLTNVLDVQATHFSQPAVNKDLSSNENSEPLQIPQKEDLRLNQFPVNTIPTNTHPHRASLSDDFTSDSTKNSLISLFLSHLERKNPVESGDDILGNITDSSRSSDEKALDKCKNGFVRIYDENSNLSSNMNLSRAGGFTCNVSDASRTCSPNSESLNLKHHGFELMDNSWYKPERCARVCEATHLHGRMCCLSNLKFQNSFGQDNNRTLHEELVHKFQCGNHSDVCKFPVRCIPSCLVCRERLSACCTCDSEKPPCISSTHETLPTCGAHCISRCRKRAISLLEEGKDCIVGDTNKRPKLSSQCEDSCKDAPGKNFLGKYFPLKDVSDKFFVSDKETSSISSGSSAPAVTEVSAETDKDLEVSPAGMSILVPVPADEASLIEICGSSDEKHEICTTIQPSLSATHKFSTLKRERPVMPTDSLTKKPCNDVRLVKRDKKSMKSVHYRPPNHPEIKEVFSMENRKDKLEEEDRPRMNDANLEKKRNKKSVCLVHGGPVNHPKINETFSEKKKVESLVDQVHHGPVNYSKIKISEAFSEEREENSVALMHHGTMSCFNANGTFYEKNREDEVDPVHRVPTNHLEARKQPKYKYLSKIEIKESETKNKNNHPFCAKRNKPIVCGNLGIISNGMTNDALKPVKIVSLVSVLERTKTSCDKILQNKAEKLSPLAKEKPRMCDLRNSTGLVHNNSMSSVIMVKPTLSRSAQKCKNTKSNEFGEYSGKNKRVKMKSISLDIMETERMSKFEHSSKSGTGLVQEESNNVIHVGPSLSSGECQLFPASQGSKSRHAEEHKHLLPSDLSCSVCRSSTEEDINKLLQCQHCTIMVHQACYGITRQPKGPWICRPCKAGLFDPVCVLCGYRGGAMTRALKPQKLVNSLIEYFHKPGFGSPSTQLNGADENRSMVHWVHMVCCLWTPSTRCPNVNTMAAFDLSGTSPSRKNSICSVCRRPGGSCVKCRISGCTALFHPWCAHQKGLLQNEVEGEHSEKVGFYGRCIYHTMANKSDGEILYFEANKKYASNEGWTCARTEVFKGQKRRQYENPTSDNIARKGDSKACIVSEEQINAWLRINGQKPFSDMAVKSLSSSDVELDLQKEYMRYKQLKGWKHLVVYKSRIHALGLYTSCFIPHGAMVVEYVGEMVRLRVADKREKEYQSGQKLHSKSACYFFRIDEENIIDATRKGGISRFVNHSCSANCVAKIISVFNEKKVVFIAERDINPGEEITYDYHFNPENEGEKIPCFCNSKNCRQFLN